MGSRDSNKASAENILDGCFTNPPLTALRASVSPLVNDCDHLYKHMGWGRGDVEDQVAPSSLPSRELPLLLVFSVTLCTQVPVS